MKHVIRAIVIALAVTGAAASTQISTASAKSKVTIARNSALPVPMCAPDDQTAAE